MENNFEMLMQENYKTVCATHLNETNSLNKAAYAACLNKMVDVNRILMEAVAAAELGQTKQLN